MDLNKVMIIGRLTRDPELRTTPTGTSVCQLGLATNFVYTNQQSGQKVENVEYYLVGGVYYAEVGTTKTEDKVGYEVVTIIQTYEIY